MDNNNLVKGVGIDTNDIGVSSFLTNDIGVSSEYTTGERSPPITDHDENGRRVIVSDPGP